MEVKYHLDLEDHLTYKLFSASKSSQIKKDRTMRWLGTTLVFLAVALMSYYHKITLVSYVSGIAALLVFITYPTFYLKWLYKRHYKNHLKNSYNTKAVAELTLKITEDTISIEEEGGELTQKISQINQIDEIADYYFIQLLSGITIIIPKKKLENISVVAEKIKALAEKNKIPYHLELDWKWR